MRLGMIGCMIASLSAGAASANEVNGWYLGGGIALGTSAQPYVPAYPDYRLDSPSVTAFVGYNKSYGSFVFGPEFAFRANAEGQTIGYSASPIPGISFESELKEAASGQLSYRAGFMMGSSLIYARAGIGTSRIEWEGTDRFLGRISVMRSHYNSTNFSAGIGAEYSFDRVFFRLEGEARRLSFGDTGYTQYQAISAVGLRF